MPFLKPGNRLYYYCKLSTVLEEILPNYQLLLSPLQKTNDPRETKRVVFDHRSKHGTDIGDISVLNKEYSEIIKGDCKVLCFSQDYNYYWGCLLSKMWAHYGDNHKGVCLCLDKEKFIQENSDKISPDLFKPIMYIDHDHNKPIEHKEITDLKII